MWNEQLRNTLRKSTYRSLRSIQVLEMIGFKKSGTGNKCYLMSFSNDSENFEDFTIQKGDMALVAKQLQDILDKVYFNAPYFDYLYENTSWDTL